MNARRSYLYQEIDVMSSGQEAWKVYEFDTPVIHVYRLASPTKESGQQTVAKECGKLMHRFTEDQVLRLLNEAEKT